ncbi:hypothetical protein EV284_6500 [Streptomyces sp. BK022]|uniref:hypothetical protein n=1 Tax=Streptomyces sp. BK022 TaxID=2512123 RepID=UPI0010E28D18|nr:hypothetical protein [Streptomyces sp. BK022]RZU28334.1 hypothetical protein EV284_6500 [Streptomyces sp. BK022]
MGEGLQAGRLDVPVVADLSGFAQKLRTDVEAAAEGLTAKIKLKVDGKGFRKQLERTVKEAAKGVTATVKVKIDEERVRSEIDGLRRRLDESGLTVPVTAGNDRNGQLGNGVRRQIDGVQGEVDRRPITVPVTAGKSNFSLRSLGIGAIASLAQPAVALLGQYGAGLTALASSAAPAVGVLGALPGLISAAATAMIGGKVAFSGFGDAVQAATAIEQKHAAGTKVTKAEQQKLNQTLGNLSTSARKTVTEVTGLSGAWAKVRKSVSERFFSKIQGDIKPLADKTLPLLEGALGGVSGQLGSLAARGAKYMQSGVFRKDFKTIAGTNSHVVGNMVNGLANLGHATQDFMVASGPFVRRVGDAGEKFTLWLRAQAKAGRETGSLARFLDEAGNKAAQLGRATGNLIGGLGGVGKAAKETGDSLLDGLEGSLLRFKRWANSKAGQVSMKDFFADAAPTFHEVNRLFGDLMRGMGRGMRDGGITDLVRQIRLQLVPALGTFFNALGHSVGPAVIAVISNIATAIGHVSEAGTGLGVLLAAFNGLLHVFNAVMAVIPGANTGLAALLGTMLALKVVTSVANALRGFGTRVASLTASSRTLGATLSGSLGASAIGPQATVWQRMSGSYQRASQEGNRLTGTLRGIGRANGVAMRSFGGITSALGGPLGIAITAITIGLGLLATKHEQAARAAAAQKEQENDLAAALKASGGAIDANVRAQAASYLQDAQLSNGKGKLMDALRAGKIELKDATNAYLGQGASVDELRKKLYALAEGTKEYKKIGADTYVLKMSEQGEQWKAAGDDLGKLGGHLKDVIGKQKAVADAANSAADSGTGSYGRLKIAVSAFNDETKSSDERVKALGAALDALSGNVMSIHDATARLDQTMLQVDEAMKGNIQKADGWGKALIGADKLVNTSTKNGQQLNQQLMDLRDGMLQVSTSAREAADQGQIPLAQAMKTSENAAERARAKAIDLAVAMGVPVPKAKALADQMGLIPNEVSTAVTTNGIPEATADVFNLRGELSKITPTKGIQINAPTVEARAQIEALGFKVQRIPGSKKVAVTAPTKGARVDLNALAQDIASAPDRKKVTVQAIVKQAASELKNVQNKVANLKGKNVEVKAPTKVAQAALAQLGYKIKTVDGTGGKKVRITAPTGTPISQIAAIQGKINSLQGRTVNVVVRYSAQGKPYMTEKANGGIVQYANGGIRAMAGRVKAFANGAERHIAQIAQAGEMRLWAEPETGGEAYIPLAPGKRKRSEQILDRVAEMFGGRVVYFANNSMRQYAQGGVRTRSTPARQRVETGRAAQALVGGDLNVNVGAVDSTATAMEDVMYELRLLRMGGGGYGEW